MSFPATAKARARREVDFDPEEFFRQTEGEAPANSDAPPKRLHRSISDVIAEWRAEGPLEIIPTGIAPLDEATRGGITRGRLWAIIAPPNAMKTAFQSWMGRRLAELGYAVGFHAADELDEDLVPRQAQQEGYERSDCEVRNPATLDAMERDLARLRMRFYGPEVTVEEATADLAAWAKEIGAIGGVYLPDSLQTIRCAASLRAETPKAIVDANVVALKLCVQRYRLVCLFTSEMNRNAYRSEEAAEQSNDMAAGKESGSIEYAVKCLLSFRTVKDRPDLVHVRIVKNKRGPSYPVAPDFRLVFSRNAHRFSLDSAPIPDAVSGDEQRKAAVRKQVSADAQTLAATIIANQGIGERELRAELHRRGNAWGVKRLEAAKRELGGRLENRGEHARDVRWHLSPEPQGGSNDAA